MNEIPHFSSLAQALASLFGSSARVLHTDRLSGGDINKAYGLHLANGSHIFMKANAKENAAFFTAEAAGLGAIARTGAIGTPKILCTGTDDGEQAGYSFLLLEFVESAAKRADYWQTFGRELAELHQADTSEFVKGGKFGFLADNFIGASAQKNTAHKSWVSFFREERLLPQFRAAASHFDEGERKQFAKLLDHLDDFLIEPGKPSLLHGDLWGGNAICGSDGKAWLIDPATYIGHAEADIAMTELFGGFPREFYSAYREVNPLEAGYEERRDLYNLYHLLNHLNMFGRSYLGAVKSIVAEYAG